MAGNIADEKGVAMERRYQTEEEPKGTASGQTYVGAGAKDTHHGYTFQFHLLMLYGMRAFRLGLKEFQLATEMADAEKFDDVVLSYRKDTVSGGRCFQFVQAKHARSKNTKSIRASQLFDEHGGDFSLTKYFDSFCKIKRNANVIGIHDEIESLVICSNMAFKFGEKVRHFVLEEAIFQNGGRDRILSNDLLKFKGEFRGRKQLVTLLKNSRIDLPSKFAKAVTKGDKLVIPQLNVKSRDVGLSRSYYRALLEEVVDADCKMFREGFLNGSRLSCAAEHYRDELWLKYLDIHGTESTTEESFRAYLEERAFLDVVIEGGLDVDQEGGLRGSPKAMAKHFEHLISENKESKVIRVDQNDVRVLDSINYMMDFVLVQEGNAFVFSPGFFSCCWMPKALMDLRESLKARVKNIGLEFEELGRYSFYIDNCLLRSTADRYDGDRLELDVREFLSKLVFVLRQPGIEEMETSIKREMADCLNVKDASNPYGRYFNMMYAWAESREARYMTEKDLKEFFHRRKKEIVGCIRFNLRDPVIDFVGRETQLKEIEEFLHGGDAPEKRCRLTPRSLIISGLGGMGKSELAREYAKRKCASVYDNIVWISAENNEGLERSFTTLAFQRLGIKRETQSGEMKDVEVVVQEVYSFFRGKNTLFIFDNAEVSDHLRMFFPSVTGDENVYVLVTSRSKDWRGFRVLSMENFSRDEAYYFIETSIGHMGAFDKGSALELAKCLSYFPLTLKQAVSFIGEKMDALKLVGDSFSISDYLKLFEKQTDKMLNHPLPEELLNNYSLTTFKTMNIAVDHVKKSKNSKVAIALLNTMSYLSPDNVDTTILSCSYLDYTDEQVGSALVLLSKLSIVSFEGSSARIHRLVQLVNRISLRNRGDEESVLECCFFVCALMDVEHTIMVWEASSAYKNLVRKKAHIPLDIMAQLSKKSMCSSAIEFGEKAIKLLTRHIGPEHLNTLITRRGHARAFYFSGLYKEAAALQKELVHDFRRVIGDRNAELYEALYHYGVTLIQLREVEASLEIFREIIEKGKSVVTDDKIYSAKIQISQIMDSMGWENKDDLNEEIYLRSKSIAEEYERCKGSKPILEDILRNQNLNDKTVDRCLKFHELCNRKTGMVGHLDIDTVIQAKIVLARFSRVKKDWEETLLQYRSVSELLMKTYGEEHIKTRDVMVRIAEALLGLGKFEEALMLLEKELEYQSVEGCPVNSSMSEMKYHMISALLGLGRHEDAVPYIVECVTSPATSSKLSIETQLEKMCVTLQLLIEKEFYEASMKILSHFFNLFGQYSGDPTDFLEPIQGAAIILRDKGQKKEALEILKNIYGVYKSKLGEDNFKTLSIKYLFADTYCAFGKSSTLKKGLGYLLELYEVVRSKISEGDTIDEFSPMIILLGAVVNDILQHGSEDLVLRTLNTSYKWAVNVLGPDHPFTENVRDCLSADFK